MLKIRRKIKVYGIVQGIGFRPFVKRTADRFCICGDVCNKGSYVEIHAEGAAEDLQKFRKSLTEDAPSVSHIVRIEEHPEVPHGETEFRIIESVAESGEMFVSPDLAVCPECKRELFDPKNRRYLHPFINCTNCGPRLTILDSMPYDRVRTTMRKFPMCKECSYEYTHPSTRRYHAQPVCCNADGPELMLIENCFSEDGNNSAGNQMTKTQTMQITKVNQRNATLRKTDLAEAGTPDGDEAKERIANRDRVLKRAREILRNGGILAVKGIGGFHLACDAANEDAVQRLRTLKKRPMKPFAVMMRDLETVKRECEILPGEEEILDGVEKPILILKKKRCDNMQTEAVQNRQQIPSLASSVAPDNPTVGVMLPYAPVQLLLFQYPDGKSMTDMLVMTSGNPSGAPICRTTEEAVRYLSPMCDAILTNNRDILTRADDSVMQFEEGKPYMIRRSRGYAPLPFTGQEVKGQVLAVGGELKNTFVLAKNELYYPSAYIGDLEDARSIDALSDTVPRMERLLEIQPEIVACDLHPGYHSTAFAKKYAKDHNLPLLQVQHHYAHILSCMAENDYEGKVIGISFDGTGYGTDGTVWGGEFLLASPENFVRLGSIEPFRQAGGDAASKEGWRIAVSLLYRMHTREQKMTTGHAHNNSHAINIEETLTDEQKKSVREAVREDALALQLCDERSLSVELFMLEHNMNCVESTSAGRFFDAVSAILGIRRKSTFEGEASMALEYASDPDVAAITHPEMILIREEKTEQDNDAKEQKKHTKEETREKSETNSERKKEDVYSGRRFVFRDDDLIRKLVEEQKKGTSVSALAGEFHTYLAEMILEGARHCRDLTGVTTVALSGGCFQNLLLLRKCKKLLREDGFQVLTHSLVSPNDGGIALGQAWAAMKRCQRGD